MEGKWYFRPLNNRKIPTQILGTPRNMSDLQPKSSDPLLDAEKNNLNIKWQS